MTAPRSIALPQISTPKLWRFSALIGAWVAVGVVSAIQNYLSETWGGGHADLVSLMARQIRNALPWVPVTLLVIAIARRLPLRSIGLARWAVMHTLFGVLTVIAINAIQAGMYWIIDGPMTWYSGWLDAVVSETLRWGQAAFVVYGLLVAVAWLVVERRGAGKDVGPHATAPRSTPVEVRVGNTVRYIAPAEIDWIEGAGDYARLHVKGNTYLSTDRLGALEKRLAASGLIRIHRSTIVNLERVLGYTPATHGDFVVELRDGSQLKGSRRHRSVLELIRNRARSDR